MKKVLLVFAALMAASCAGEKVKTSLGDLGNIVVKVSGAKSFNPNISHGKIAEYVVTISGEPLETPVSMHVGGDDASASFDGLPAGNYKIVCDAINENGLVIKTGITNDVVVSAGEVSDADVEMMAVPVFANVVTGAVVANTRFSPKIFVGSDEPVEIEDEFNGVILPLMDLSNGESEIYPDASNGMASAKFGPLAAGPHKLKVKNVVNGMESEVEVTLVDGSKISAAPLFAGGSSQSVIGGLK